jgi:hypothetical protein
MRSLPVVIASLSIAAPAQGAIVDRSGMHGLDPRFPAALTIVLPSPEDFGRGCCVTNASGEWKGPRATGGDEATLAWSTHIVKGPVTPEQAARGRLAQGFSVELAGGSLDVRHTIGAISTAAMPGGWVLRKEGTGARHEAAVGFALTPTLTAVVRFAALSPAGEDQKVNGVEAAVYNRTQIERAIKNALLDGSLPPRSVGIKRGGRITGTVKDRYGAPVVGASVTLERRVGSRWRRVRSGRASVSGAYSLRPRGEAVYRVTARLGGFLARSRKVRAG